MEFDLNVMTVMLCQACNQTRATWLVYPCYVTNVPILLPRSERPALGRCSSSGFVEVGCVRMSGCRSVVPGLPKRDILLDACCICIIYVIMLWGLEPNPYDVVCNLQHS